MTGQQFSNDQTGSQSKKKVGQILCEKGYVNQAQLDQAVFHQHISAEKLGQILVNLGYITQAQLNEALALQVQNQRIG